jgi:hypothetical protein
MLLNPTKHIIEDGDKIKESIDFTKYRTHGDPWFNNYESLNNLILGLHSLNQVTQLWKNNNIKYGTKYDAILYLRPDVLYYKPLKLEYFYPMEENSILLPDFEQWPVNDRLAIGPPDVMKIYGERFIGAYDYSLTNQLHTETYLNYILEKNKINIKKFHYNFSRIKINGQNREPWYYETYNDTVLFFYNLIG